MSAETVDLVTRLIGNVGFPIFVAVWLLVRTDRILLDLKQTLNGLQEAVQRLTEVITVLTRVKS